MDDVIVSYVYTLTEDTKNRFEGVSKDNGLFMPMLFRINVNEDAEKNVFSFYSLPCFFNHNDFARYKDEGTLIGTVPNDFSDIPYRRFGCTGLFRKDNEIYCGSWNGIYVVDEETLQFKRFITNEFTQDIHGLFVWSNGQIITMLASQDAVVITNPDGSLAGCFSVNPDLTIGGVEVKDWRLYNKDRRGVCGVWHFNYVQQFGNELWLTSRCINGFVVVDLDTMKVRLQTLRLGEEALIHDGIWVDNAFYFTSIGGKIIRATKYEGNENSGLNTKVFQLSVMDNDQRKLPNWGRGIGIKNDWWYTTLDGRYGQIHKGFRLVRVKEVEGSEDCKMKYQNLAIIGEGDDFDSITGFDILVK